MSWVGRLEGEQRVPGWDICASLWAQREKVLLETASETSGERNPQLRGLQQFAAVFFFFFRLTKYLLLCPNGSSSFPFVVPSLNPIRQAESRVTVVLPEE